MMIPRYMNLPRLSISGQDIDDFIQVTSEDENTITFDIYWRHGDVKVEKAEKTDDGFVCKKEDFGDEGLRLTLIPRRGKSILSQYSDSIHRLLALRQ